MKRNTTLRLVHCALGCAALLVVSAQAGTEVKPSNGNQRGSASTGSLQLVSANASGVAANASSTTCAFLFELEGDSADAIEGIERCALVFEREDESDGPTAVMTPAALDGTAETQQLARRSAS